MIEGGLARGDRRPDSKIQIGQQTISLTTALIGPDLSVLGRIFELLLMFIVVLYDFVYAFPESCSVVSHEIGRL